jgi:uncharacterized HAD superfamily protein
MSYPIFRNCHLYNNPGLIASDDFPVRVRLNRTNFEIPGTPRSIGLFAELNKASSELHAILEHMEESDVMKIAFDVDGVVLKSIDVILERINQVTDRNLTSKDLASWDLEPLGINTTTLFDAVDHMYAEPMIEPYSQAVQVLSKIYHATGEPLLFITGRPNPKTALRHLEALPWNPTVPEMVVTGGDRDKLPYLVERRVDFIVEDDILHLGEYLSEGIGVGLMLQPWNRKTEVPVTQRFTGWEEVELWFNEISRKGKLSGLS